MNEIRPETLIMTTFLDPTGLNLLFKDARTHNEWTKETVDDATLAALYDLVKMAPTSANCSPARFVFIREQQGKQKLSAALLPGNREKTMTAPVTVIVASDTAFYDKLPQLFPHADARAWFTSSPDVAAETAFRNSSMQAAYLILAARSLGLDTGPMSGFDRKKLDAEFFSGTSWKSNMLVNLGHGDQTKLFPRLPRLPFEEACMFA